MKKILSTLMLLTLATSVHADIYKWKGENGTLIYSDKAPKDRVGVNSVGKAIEPPTTPKIIPQEQAVVDPEKAAIDAENASIREKNRKAEEEFKRKEAEANAANCSNSKINLSRYSAGGRIRMYDEAGEPYYLSDADIIKGIAQSKEDIARYCK